MPDRIRTMEERSIALSNRRREGWRGSLAMFAARHLNFYRLHLLFFTFVPLIASGVFYASNGPSPENQIAYIDALFFCYSAICVCGLTTALFANITIWQQCILFCLMTMGSISFVSIVVVLVRRHFFQKRFEELIATNAEVRSRMNAVGAEEARRRGELLEPSVGHGSTAVEDEYVQMEAVKRKQKKKLERLRADMIRRVDAPVRVNEMNVSGALGENAEEAEPATGETPREDATEARAPAQHITIAETVNPDRRIGRTVTTDVPRRTNLAHEDLRLRRNRTTAPALDFPARRPSRSDLRDVGSRTLTRTVTMPVSSPPAINSNFGGFPNPIKVAAEFATSRIGPLRRAAEQQSALPRTSTLVSTRSRRYSFESSAAPRYGKPVSYISFDATVGRNSRFHHLTTAQQEELGGIEYRALMLLLKIIVGYWLGIQLVGVLTIAPWLTYSKTYAPIFQATNPNINPTFFSFFQVFSGLSNTGMSLVDASMVPFNSAYWLVILIGFLILAGNTALPIFLRLTIWTMSKAVPSGSRTQETLQFLLDHPRRCYVYLFPSHQTWLLVFVLICLNGIDWIAFVVLDIGNPTIEALSPGIRCLNGWFQAVAVRTAGFSIVSLAALAPAVQYLFVIMMIVAAYPIAITVRSTNVYEDQAVGVQEEEPTEAETELELQKRPASEYILFHIRRQLGFDIWFIAIAIFLLCVIERHRINSGDWPEVNIFSLVFEAASAYGTVGLSLGNNRNATSLVGVLGPLSKLIIIAVMLRGRHRGLPVAIDRSILLPFDVVSREPTLSLRSVATNPVVVDDLAPRSSMTTIRQGGPSNFVAEPQEDLDLNVTASTTSASEYDQTPGGSRLGDSVDDDKHGSVTSDSSTHGDSKKG
ncbi:hypothetical protein JCM10212_000299 [Sporobolomyces blumeae]